MHSLEVNDFVCTECSNSLYPKGFSTPFTTKTTKFICFPKDFSCASVCYIPIEFADDVCTVKQRKIKLPFTYHTKYHTD